VVAFSNGKPVATFPENALAFTLRPYAAADEDAAIELWRRT
jgi:hypothetical protein